MRELQEEPGLAHVHEGVVRRAFTVHTLCKKCNLYLWDELGPVQEMLPSTPSLSWVMTDFEQKLPKLQSSFQTVFPGVDNSWCLFHFNQAVLRKVNLIGLKVAYEEKPINPVTGRRGTSATKKHIRRACALAFVNFFQFLDQNYDCSTTSTR